MTIRFEPIVGKCGEIVESLMQSEDMPKDDGLCFKIRLSVEETVENVVNYAYKEGLGYIEIETKKEDNVLSIILKDSGKPFNPLAKSDPDITLSVEERPIGGLGIFLCKQMMDDVQYSFKDGCNILTMKINV
ncbi:MAG: ATP-binding protein [Bacteroidales bacterium]|nr:ATP-binding protein [Bacteroidales bacterium]